MITVDESLIAYQPRRTTKKKAENAGESIPVMFIKRKPHKNGLLLYNAATFIQHPVKLNSKLSFILDMVCHLTPNDVSPKSSIETIMNRYYILNFLY